MDAQEDPADSFLYRNADAMTRGAALLRRILRWSLWQARQV